MSATVVWFRNSLRLADHAPLVHAAERGRVVPVFVWAPDEEGAWAPGGAHRWWLHHSLQALDGSLRDKGSRLVVRQGATLDEINAVCHTTGADRVVWQTRLAPTLRRRDEQVRAGLEAEGIEVRQFAGRILHDPEKIETGSGGPYKVFTPFWNKVSGPRWTVGEPLDVPRLGETLRPRDVARVGRDRRARPDRRRPGRRGLGRRHGGGVVARRGRRPGPARHVPRPVAAGLPRRPRRPGRA